MEETSFTLPHATPMASQSSKGGTDTETEEVLASSTIGLFRGQTDCTSKNPFTTMCTTLVMPPEVGTSKKHHQNDRKKVQVHFGLLEDVHPAKHLGYNRPNQ